jgi:ATP-dependent DNA ligase
MARSRSTTRSSGPGSTGCASGLDVWAQIVGNGYEGLVAKDEASAYEGGATRRWLMVKEDWTVAEDGWRRILEEDRR